ncbi:ATP-binding cassette domain-containing protein [Labrenzia sp. PHM005]|uniref:ATP-binding cassette domain-containing protein n=1 Tax=Labrenzia sp. PHM005 TaxID=2590016 RepID=UPI00113FE748|nr:ATP-binding cassette domain-containing protein [Labrenzia sp. PHM005]QDG75927.1 ATP-binding cassette domain-containing protein [Labrenzia sp. PHM005]
MRNMTLDTQSAPSASPVPDTREILLETRGLGFETSGHQLLSNIDLQIRRGSRTVIMGPNGAGKSLLLRLLHGLIIPTHGQIFWQDRKLDKMARQAQAMVFQRPVLLRRSAAANLKFALRVRGHKRPKCEGLIHQALNAAGLAHLAHRPARVLSGGEQQRLATVRALACEPDLLFLDEPTASLDPASTAAIEQLILDANAKGITIVLVTHDAGQASRLGQDVVFLQDGRVAETGTAGRVLTIPKSEPARAWRDGRLYTSQ